MTRYLPAAAVIGVLWAAAVRTAAVWGDRTLMGGGN